MIMPKLPKLKLLFETIPWKSFKCSKKQLRIDIVLKCGQSFRWEEEENKTSALRTWTGVLQSKIWQIAQDDTSILYKSLPLHINLGTASSQLEDQDETFLKDYFQLEVDLEPLYAEWSKNDPVFQKISETFGGVRILRQDPVENLFAFICSSNNNIQRISGMVQQLCTKYGEYIGNVDNKSYYAFPEISTLANQKKLESELRSLGFGYRAGYISKTAMKLDSLGGREYLLSLRCLPYAESRKCLLDLSGIGPKVSFTILKKKPEGGNCFYVLGCGLYFADVS